MTLSVAIVSPEKEFWSGEATQVSVTTVEGDLGILTGHEPVLAALADGVVRVTPTDGPDLRASVLGGFLSVAENRVNVLAEVAELADDIDVSRAQEALRRAQSEDDQPAARRATARLRAAGQGTG